MTTPLHSGGPLVVLHEIHVTLGSAAGPVNILRGISFEVGAGETVSIVGPSGSGKSTLLMVLGGLERPSAGRVEIGGDDLGRLGEDGLARLRRARIGIVFQSFHLIPTMTALENVAIPLELGARRDAFEAAAEGLAAVGLAHRLTHYPGQLSGGEQQRVALARALAAAPRLLMLDEPLGALDRALRERLVTELRALFVRLGLTSLFVTHDHDEAFALADRLVVMHEGRIEQVGTPVDVWQRPANAFVARFLGWNVTHAFADGVVAVRADGLELVEVADARVTGTVTARTFRREHFLLDVDLEGVEREHVQAEVPLDHVRVPDVGAVVGVRLVPGAAVPLP